MLLIPRETSENSNRTDWGVGMCFLHICNIANVSALTNTKSPKEDNERLRSSLKQLWWVQSLNLFFFEIMNKLWGGDLMRIFKGILLFLSCFINNYSILEWCVHVMNEPSMYIVIDCELKLVLWAFWDIADNSSECVGIYHLLLIYNLLWDIPKR